MRYRLDPRDALESERRPDPSSSSSPSPMPSPAVASALAGLAAFGFLLAPKTVELPNGQRLALHGSRGPPLFFSPGLFGTMTHRIYGDLFVELKRNFTIVTLRDLAPVTRETIDLAASALCTDRLGFVSHSSFDLDILSSPRLVGAVLCDPIVLPDSWRRPRGGLFETLWRAPAASPAVPVAVLRRRQRLRRGGARRSPPFWPRCRPRTSSGSGDGEAAEPEEGREEARDQRQETATAPWSNSACPTSATPTCSMIDGPTLERKCSRDHGAAAVVDLLPDVDARVWGVRRHGNAARREDVTAVSSRRPRRASSSDQSEGAAGRGRQDHDPVLSRPRLGAPVGVRARRAHGPRPRRCGLSTAPRAGVGRV